MALALSTAAADGGLAGGLGLLTVHDLRRFLTPEQLSTGGKQNWVSTMPITGSATADQTVGKVAKGMRDRLTQRIEKGEWLGIMRTTHNTVFRHPWRMDPCAPGLGIELSSVGPIRVKYPVENCHISMNCPNYQPYRGISLLNYSVEHLDRNETNWVGLYRVRDDEYKVRANSGDIRQAHCQVPEKPTLNRRRELMKQQCVRLTEPEVICPTTIRLK
jgi:hypothetical protein